MRKLIAAVALALALTGCGGSDSESNTQLAQMEQAVSKLPNCDDWQGKPVSAQQWKNTCLQGKRIELSMNYECRDGTTLHWNDWGWGYADKPAQKHVPAEGQQPGVPPKAEINKCLGY